MFLKKTSPQLKTFLPRAFGSGGVVCALLVLSGLFSPVAKAVDYQGKVAPLTAETKAPGTEGVGITEKLGAQLDLSLPVVDEQGVTRQLGDYFHAGRPVILSLVYYSCPGLCNFHLNGLVEALKGVDWTPGEKFEVLALSFDPKEGPALAAGKKANYLNLYERPAAAGGMHFLTASQPTISKLAEEVGFQYRWDENSNEWAHASAAILVSPTGKVTRYLHGIMFGPQDVKLALGEASEGRIGTIVDKMIWYCFMYDPKQSKYTLAAFRLVQLGGGIVILILAGLLIPQWMKTRQSKV